MRLVLSCAAILAIATAATAQPAAEAAAGGDAACLVAMVALSNSADPNDQAFGQVGTVYFMGRIAGRNPGYDFARLRSLAAGMDAKVAQADLQQSCKPTFQKAMQQLADTFAGSEPPVSH